jgi:hypothetical protein
MDDMDRRSALAFGFATAATLPAVLTPTPAFAQRYRPDEGREIAPGVRRVELTKRASEIPAYATVSMRDMVYQPGAKSENPAMANDMVCHCLEGELQVSQGPDKQFVAKTGDVWSCMKRMPETNVNNGSTVAIMRVIDLIPPA